MCFKSLAAWVALLALAAGCGPKMLPMPDAGMSIGGSEAGCLSKAGPKVRHYIDGQATEAETISVFDCASKSLELFAERTRGEREGVYAPEELRAFLEKYFLENTRISDRFLGEAMEIKRVLVGGTASALTRAELERMQALLGQFKTHALTLRMHMPVTAQAMATRSDDDVQAASIALSKVAQGLGTTFDAHRVTYSFTQFDSLIVEAVATLGADTAPVLVWIHDKLKLVELAKGLLVAPPANRVEQDQWSRLLNVGARWYGLLLRSRVLEPGALKLELGDAKLEALSAEAFALLDEAIARRPGEAISVIELRSVLEGVWPEHPWMRSDSVVTRVITLKQALLGGPTYGISRGDVERLHVLWKRANQVWPGLKPYFKSDDGALVLPNAAMARSPEFTAALLRAGQVLGRELDQSRGPVYSLTELEALVAEVEPHLGGLGVPRVVELAELLHKHLPLARQLKGLLISLPGDRLGGGEWALTLETAARWLQLVVKAGWLEPGARIELGSEQLATASQEAFALLDAALERRGAAVSSAEIQALVEVAVPQHPWLASDEWLTRSLRLKQALLGGQGTGLARGDITRLQALWAELNRQWPELQPVLDELASVLASERGKTLTDQRAQQLAAVLMRAGQGLGRELDLSHGADTSLADVEKLLAYAQAHWPASEGESPLKRASELAHAHLALAQQLKGLLISLPADRLKTGEWALTLTQASAWVGLGLRVKALTSERGFTATRAPWLARLQSIASEGVGLLDAALARKPGQVATFADINALIAAALPPQGLKLMDHYITVPHLQTVTRDAIRRILGGADMGATGRQAPGLTRPSLARLWAHLSAWASGQAYLERVYRDAAQRLGVDQRALELAGLPPEEFKATEPPASEVTASKLSRIAQADMPLFVGESDRIFFGGGKAGAARQRKHSFHNLAQANWRYEVARAVATGLADDPVRATAAADADRKATFAEFKVLVNMIQDVGLDLKLIDPEDKMLAEKRFREANLFSAAANGDEYFSVPEGANLLALMLSGKGLANEIHAGAIAAGCRTGGLDPFDYLLIDAACYRKHFFGNVKRYWRDMPKLAEAYLSLDRDWREIFEIALENAASKRGYDGRPGVMMNSSDSEGFGTIGHYIESVYARFDEDDSGFLEWYEAKSTFPVFQSTLHEVSCMQGHCLNSSSDLWAVFSYMIDKGFAPSTLQFIGWKIKLVGKPWLQSNRLNIMRIFGELGKGNAQGQ